MRAELMQAGPLHRAAPSPRAWQGHFVRTALPLAGRRRCSMARRAAEGTAQAPAASVNGTPRQTVGPQEDTRAAQPPTGSRCCIVVLGASGDLARKKIFPSLFALYYGNNIPRDFAVVGYARSRMTDAEFRSRIESSLACRVDAGADCGAKMQQFLQRVHYVSGQYDSIEDFAELDRKLGELEEGSEGANRLFYLSLPPSVFLPSCQCLSRQAAAPTGWTRVIVEKPFGRDLSSYQELDRGMKEVLREDQIFRIDHYLGKELVENLTALRFSNLVFEPLWSRQYIRNVQITFTENFGTQGRGGYYDQYGVLRDIIQNHLLQVLALFAMEPPVSLGAEDVRNEKVKVLRSISPIRLEDVVLGQYKGVPREGLPGYLDDDTVPPSSTTPTFAAMVMFINNPRWDGVPILVRAGKALVRRVGEIRIQFRHVPGNLFKAKYPELNQNTNELVIQIQPDEQIYMRINNKLPGLGMRLGTTRLDLIYHDKYRRMSLPDAYERLILDAINGDRRLFIRDDELQAAWELFTPLLNEVETRKLQPEQYPYGSRGPVGAYYLAARYNVRWGEAEESE